MKLLLGLFLLISSLKPKIFLVQAIKKCSNSGATKICDIFGNYSSTLAPIVYNQTLVISSEIELIDIIEINEHNFYISLSIQLSNSWLDHRLDLKIATIQLTEAEAEEIWKPNIYIYDLKRFNFKSSISQRNLRTFKVTKLNESCLITTTSRFDVDITCGFNHTEFPFDTQYCLFRFGVQDYTLEQIEFESALLVDFTDFNDPAYESQHTKLLFSKTSSSLRQRSFDFGGNFYAYTGISVTFTREFEKYMIEYYVPMFLFVTMSWLSFLIPYQQVKFAIISFLMTLSKMTFYLFQVPGRMGLLVTLFLILINTYNSTISTAPPIKVKHICLKLI